MLGFCPTVVNKMPLRALRGAFATTRLIYEFLKVRTFGFMTRLNFPCGEMDARRYSVMKKYFAIVGPVPAFTVSWFAQQ
jgi:hypothetical protein